MRLYSKSDMYYADYSWTEYGNDNPKVSGEPDNTYLNRYEGNEILYIINKFSDLYRLRDKTVCTIIERMIRERVPANILTQKEIKKWIIENWESYKTLHFDTISFTARYL